MPKVLAMTVDGRLTYCTASPENIGKGRCNHIGHKIKYETNENFVKRSSESIVERNKRFFIDRLQVFKDILFVDSS